MRRDCLTRRLIEGEIEGRIEVAGRREKRSKQLLGDFKETRGYWKLKSRNSLLHTEEKSLSKRLRTCRKTDYGNNE